MMEKHCSHCQKTKPIEEFYNNKSSPDSLASDCKQCHNASNAKSFLKHKQKRHQTNRLRLQSLIREFIAAYGGACECCGETEWTFLTVDHMTPSSRKPHKTRGTLSMLYNLRRRKWPREGYRLHCFNCNLGRERASDRLCIHEKEVTHGEP